MEVMAAVEVVVVGGVATTALAFKSRKMLARVLCVVYCKPSASMHKHSSDNTLGASHQAHTASGLITMLLRHLHFNRTVGDCMLNGNSLLLLLLVPVVCLLAAQFAHVP